MTLYVSCAGCDKHPLGAPSCGTSDHASHVALREVCASTSSEGCLNWGQAFGEVAAFLPARRFSRDRRWQKSILETAPPPVWLSSRRRSLAFRALRRGDLVETFDLLASSPDGLPLAAHLLARLHGLDDSTLLGRFTFSLTVPSVHRAYPGRLLSSLLYAATLGPLSDRFVSFYLDPAAAFLCDPAAAARNLPGCDEEVFFTLLADGSDLLAARRAASLLV